MPNFFVLFPNRHGLPETAGIIKLVIVMYIYVDVLLILNLYVNYFLLRATGRLMHLPCRRKRCIAAAAVGSLCALTIFLPALHWALCTLLRFAMAVPVVWICFGRRMRLRDVVCFFLVSMGFGGAMLAVSLWRRPVGMAFNNASLYLDFSPGMLLVCTVAAYALTCGIRFLADRSTVTNGRYRVVIRQGARVIGMDALADSGNLLTDRFSGKPVILCGGGALEQLVQLKGELTDPAAYAEMVMHCKGMRLIPCATVTGSGVVPVFAPDEVLICEACSGLRKPVDALIGIQQEREGAIFNPKLLI